MRRVCCIVLLVTAAWGRDPVRARSAMVVTQEPHATDVGVAVLKSGGNAIDAAVAVGFALAVTYPYAGALGGGGFLLYRPAKGDPTFIDFRERAPLRATRDMYLDANGNPTRDSIEGWRASAVPGGVAGFAYAHAKYGRKKWSELVAPAVRLAAKGFEVSFERARQFAAAEKRLNADPESRRIFMKGGAGCLPGDRLIQSDLAKVLRRIQRRGAADFYEGETARRIAAAMAKNGGLITLEDLRQYRAIERQPLLGTYKGYGVITAPPPSSGGVGMLQMLAMLEGSDYEKKGRGSAATIHYMAEVMRRYYADRSEYLGDPDFFEVPIPRLLDPRYIASRRATITDRVTPSETLAPGRLAAPDASDETMHFSILDAEGNAVALTYTLNGGFGNGITLPGLGILMNNEMDDFSAKPGAANMFGAIGGVANEIAPKKTPLSSMTPTIVTKDGAAYLVVGAPGGTRIITSVMQVILNVLDFGLNIQDAIDQPRFHHQWKPDRLDLEPNFSPDTIALLREKGHTIDRPTGVIAAVQGIMVEDTRFGRWVAGAWDGRGTGKAAGY
jgi:gamma-glutamyltranspeptidase/glutathione hydrolase